MKNTASHSRLIVARIFCSLYLMVAIVSSTTQCVKCYLFINNEKQISLTVFDQNKNTSEKQAPQEHTLDTTKVFNDLEDTTEYLYLDNHFVDKKSVVFFSTKLFFGYSLKNNFEYYSEILIPPPQA